MQEQPSNLNNKIKLIPFVVLIAMGIIGARLYYLQIEQNKVLFDQSHKNCTRIDKTQSPRGNILDVTGSLLATNRPLTNVYWQGSGTRKLTQAQQDILEKIGA
ncbi:MAG: hypothetical protein P4L31_02550, partial [Candidatus Babeliales bacterium]|nr:hypothetical protein [Candidatus Babeliales bacterium]